MRVDVAHDEGFGLVNPLSVKKQIEGQITWFYNDAMYQECNVKDGRIAENNFDSFLLSRIKEDPPEINIRFFKTGHWLDGMGHDRGTSIQSGHCRCGLPDHRKALSRPALAQSRPDLELSHFRRGAISLPVVAAPSGGGSDHGVARLEHRRLRMLNGAPGGA